MRAVDLVIVLCWAVFWVYWLVTAATAKPGQGRWSGYAAARIALIVVFFFLVREFGFRGHQLRNGPVLAGVGLALFFLGLALAVWARRCIGRNWGTPMSRKVEPELVTTGPYRRVRHPIYTGLILAMLGTALATTLYGLIAVAVLGGFFVYSATREEKYLAGEFPDTYPGYKRSTSMLIPFVFLACYLACFV
jgi:protein-S-isoprenylcysteine O-methyltransferase Ste14